MIALDRNLEGTLPYFFSLLGIEDPTASLQQMDPQVRRQRTFEALKQLVLRESLNQPLMVIFEDLHWIDDETQGFLDTLSESTAGASIVLLVNYRPEYRHDWGGKTYYTQLRLAPLGSEEAKELLTFLVGNDTSLQDLKQLILERTEGTPFFMEEVVQTLAEEGVLLGERGNCRLEKIPTELHISPTVQGVLAARIDRLEPAEKTLLQQLSVIGREFPLGLVGEVVNESEDELHRLLFSLQRKEFLYEQPAFPEVECVFKHALTQEVAYGTVLQEQRKALHERTAQAIEVLYPDTLEDHYRELAHHYGRSDNIEKAIEYLGLAGRQASQRSANVEAIGHFTKALDVLQTLPNTPERSQQELSLQVSLAVPLTVSKGWSAPEVGKVYARARELCAQVGETQQLFPTLFGLWSFYLLRAELNVAHDAAKQLLTLAENAEDADLLLEAKRAMALTLVYLGEFVSAREHSEAAMALYDPQMHRSHIALYGVDPGVASLSYSSWPLWFLGYPDQAIERIQQAITLAHESHHPFSLAYPPTFACWVHQWGRDGQAVQERAEGLIALCTEHGITPFLAYGTIFRGWALAAQGQVGEGIAQIREGLVAYGATGGELGRSHFLGMLAEVRGQAGQAEDGLATVTEALTFVDQTDERLYEAELHRLKGELTLQSPAAGQTSKLKEEVEACFQKALDIARQQKAKSWELRAAMSLARLWQQEGRDAEARELLAPVYEWFTEGFDTADLKDAKALLGELTEGC